MILNFLNILFLPLLFFSASTEKVDSQNSIIVGNPGKEIKLDQYLKLDELETLVKKLEKDYPNIVKVKSLSGKTAENKTSIWAVQISHDVTEPRKLLKPMFKFVANIHGDDVVGYALMVSLMQYLAYSDKADQSVTDLLENIDIWIVPTMNPVGLSRSTAENGNGVDLDADFPFRPKDVTESVWPCEDETKSILEFIMNNPFVLSGNLQGGAIVASYPLDSPAKDFDKETTDRDVFMLLASDYAKQNPTMNSGNACNNTFPDGITHGGYWGKPRGSMQDANFMLSNCFEITLHVSCSKHPEPTELPTYWEENLKSMLNFIGSTRRGVYGLIQDQYGNPVKDAEIAVQFTFENDEKEKNIRGTEQGEYWRLLGPGQYVIGVFAPATTDLGQGFVNVTKDEPYVRLDITVNRQGLHGLVQDQNSNPVKDFEILIEKTGRKINGNEKGEYVDYLRFGYYQLQIKSPGCYYKGAAVNVTEENPYVRLDINLTCAGIHGRVMDEAGNVIKGALVQMGGSEVENWANKYGEYATTTDLIKSEHIFEMTASAYGYRTVTKRVKMTENDTSVQCDFVLKSPKTNWFTLYKSDKNGKENQS